MNNFFLAKLKTFWEPSSQVPILFAALYTTQGDLNQYQRSLNVTESSELHAQILDFEAAKLEHWMEIVTQRVGNSTSEKEEIRVSFLTRIWLDEIWHFQSDSHISQFIIKHLTFFGLQ